MTETLDSLWYIFGGISDVGVDAAIFLYSSEVTKVGKEVIKVAAGIVVHSKGVNPKKEQLYLFC